MQEPRDAPEEPQGSISLTITAVTRPPRGAVGINADGTLTYTPSGAWTGDDSFSYTVSNGYGGTSRGAATVTVDGVNHPPVVNNPGSQATPTDTAVSLQIQASDPEQTDFLYSAVGLPPGLVIEPMTGKIWGWIDPRARGPYDVTVSVDDLDGGETSVEFPWTVTEKNHAPRLSRGGDSVTYVSDYVSVYGPGAVDVDGDALTYSVGGLPPGVTYDAGQNLISGTPTAGGTFTVTVTASDGLGGTDQDSWTWYVLPQGTSMPFATVQWGQEPGGPSATEGIGLAHQDLVDWAFVTLINPSDPYGVCTVTVNVAPSGLSSPTESSFDLRDGEYATFGLTALKVSQARLDGVLSATVAGREAGRAGFTNIGIVLPQGHVKGPDTPDGFEDRISTGAGNWGTYFGVLQVYPNLLGLNVLNPQVQDTGGNSDDGAATMADGVASVLNNSVATVYGTAQTQPELDAEGQVVAEPNEQKLRLGVAVGLAAIVGNNAGLTHLNL